jgi:DNA-directed RNA polymerase specialized sigma subunit
MQLREQFGEGKFVNKILDEMATPEGRNKGSSIGREKIVEAQDRYANVRSAQFARFTIPFIVSEILRHSEKDSES